MTDRARKQGHAVISAVSEASLADACARLAAGGLVAIPTETVYGLAADATNGAAVVRIFEAKGRPRFNPLICHVSSLAMADRFAAIDGVARALAQAFWPGPLTLVVPLRPGHDIHPLVSAGLDTVAVRQPTGVAADIIARLDRPLAAPSANRSGQISPTTAQAVSASLGGSVDLVLDDGPCTVGVESTIVAVDKDQVTLLRPGGISAEVISAVTGMPVQRPSGGGAVTAPGQLSSHYAPGAALRINASDIRANEIVLAFGPDRVPGADRAAALRNLSPLGNVNEAATNLFAMLAELDAIAGDRGLTIAAEPVPMHGLGEAINDRLARAAAPRPEDVTNVATVAGGSDDT